MKSLDTKIYNNDAHESHSMETMEMTNKGHLSKQNCHTHRVLEKQTSYATTCVAQRKRSHPQNTTFFMILTTEKSRAEKLD